MRGRLSVTAEALVVFMLAVAVAVANLLMAQTPSAAMDIGHRPGTAPRIVKVLMGADDRYAFAAGATTLAGTGTPAFRGDGGPSFEAELDAPTAVAVDASGDVFVADAGNCRVREIPARSGISFGHRVHAGNIITIIGGACSHPKANPPPSALAVDAAGNLFIAFGPAGRVEELPVRSGSHFGVRMTAGRPAVVAGTGATGFSGDGGSAVHSELADPTGVVVDAAGDLLIADTGNCRLRLVAASNGLRFGLTLVKGHIYTVAGNGICGSSGDGGPALNAELWDPGALAVDGEAGVLVADQGNRTIVLLAAHTGTFYGVSLTAGELGTVAGEGSYGPYLIDGLPATGQTAEINFPSGIALDGKGDLYIADGDEHTIRFVPDTTTTLRGKTAQAGEMYTAAGATSTETFPDETNWIQTRMLDPTGLAVSPSGRLIYSDTEANVVRELPAGS